jgi:hypothetical protein
MFFVADAAYSHRGEHLDRAVMSSHQRVIIRGVATVVLIGIGLSLGLACKEGEDPMKESTLSKITASVALAKGMAQRALAASPNPQWTEYEMQLVDKWIARQGTKLDRSEAIRRLVELGLKVKSK